MIQPIVRDEAFLSQPSETATAQDVQTAHDLVDTLRENSTRCVGLAANMIGAAKRIIAVNDEGNILVMLNPRILRRDGPYEAEEGCLSLDGTRKARRYVSIKLQHQNLEMQTRIKTYKGRTAQIIQHEMDHCDGILI